MDLPRDSGPLLQHDGYLFLLRSHALGHLCLQALVGLSQFRSAILNPDLQLRLQPIQRLFGTLPLSDVLDGEQDHRSAAPLLAPGGGR